MSQLIACPECKKHLQVPDNLLGKKVQCPECKHTFVATGVETESLPSPSTATTASKPSPPSPPPSSPPSKPAWEKNSKSGSKSGSKRRKDDDDDDYDDRDDDDDDDDDDRPRRRSGRRRSRRLSSPSRGYSYVPHRGGMILAFGLISLIGVLFVPGVPLIFGIIAWVMGNSDMAAIRSGGMDPSGEGTTQAGRVMGIISTLLHLLGAVGCCCVIGFGAVNDGNRNRGRRF